MVWLEALVVFAAATHACTGPDWIVVTDRFDVVRDGLQAWAPQWCIVFVQSASTPPLSVPPANVVVLNPADLPHTFSKHINVDVKDATLAGRRNFGVLFAIHHHAKNVFELDSTVELTRPLTELNASSYFFTNATFNTYAYFGQPTVWPRGWPLTRIGEATATVGLGADDVRMRREVLIHHTVTDGAPELDATFRLSRIVHGATPSIVFEPRVPLCAVGAGYWPLHGQATLYAADGLWAAVLAGDDDDADILRGYWAQRVVRELGGAVAVHGPVTRRNATPAVPPASVKDEAAVLQTAGRALKHQASLVMLAAFLDRWTPPPAATTACAVAAALATDMAAARFWTTADAARVTGFLQALPALGYACPPCSAAALPAPRGVAVADTRFTVQPRGAERALPGPAAPVPWDAVHMQARLATLWRSALHLLPDGSRITDIPAHTLAVAPPPTYVPCATLLNNPAATTVPRILFVVNYHYATYANSNSTKYLLENVYAHYFNTPFDVVFTAPGGGAPGVLGNGLPEAGFYSYHSLTAAYVKYPGYDGYFLVNDDLVLAQTMFEASLFAWRWQYPWTVGVSGPMCRPGGTWPWEAYCTIAIEVFKSLCGTAYRGDACGDLGVYMSQADAFYVPGRLMREWIRWSNAFVSRAVFLELAVPTIIHGITDVHCETGTRVLMQDMFVDVCTTFTDERSRLYELLVAGREDQHCGAYHPVKFTSALIRDTVKTYFERLSGTRCRKPAGECTLTYRLDPDGFLWRRS